MSQFTGLLHHKFMPFTSEPSPPKNVQLAYEQWATHPGWRWHVLVDGKPLSATDAMDHRESCVQDAGRICYDRNLKGERP